jgi:hypothetical protein
MVARDVEYAAAELRVLRREEWARVGLVVLVFGLAAVASEVHPSLAVPLLIAALTAVGLAVRVFWRRWDLLDRLALDRDAYEIPEVRALAEHAAAKANRRLLASSIRRLLAEPRRDSARVILAAAEDLEALADELENDGLMLDPACAVACMHLLGGGSTSVLTPGRPPEDVVACVRRIRAGFRPRPGPAGVAVSGA